MTLYAPSTMTRTIRHNEFPSQFLRDDTVEININQTYDGVEYITIIRENPYYAYHPFHTYDFNYFIFKKTKEGKLGREMASGKGKTEDICLKASIRAFAKKVIGNKMVAFKASVRNDMDWTSKNQMKTNI